MDPHIREVFKNELLACLNLNEEEAEKLIAMLPEIQAVRLSASLRSKRIYDFHVSKKAAGLKGLLELFTLESLIFYQKGNKEDKFKRLLREHISLPNKIELLSNFMFTEPYKFRTNSGERRHLMYCDFLKDAQFRSIFCIPDKEPEHCSFSLCYCYEWLKEQSSVDAYIDLFAERLFEIRNAFAHEAFPILLLPSYDDRGDVASFSSALIDCYPLREDRELFRSYESSLNPEVYFRITKECMQSYVRQIIERHDA